MENAGTCDGLVKLFLLQSKLNPEITHFEFFTKLMAPYLSHINSTDSVYGGSTMSGIHKNAWNSKVLNNSNAFDFAVNPSMDGQGVFNGIDVSCCMRLVHYVLFQGLGVTNDWKKDKHENSSFVSCVHLRNISHMSLGCIELLLHSCCDKAMIPANGGRLHLPVPSPFFESKDEAYVKYDPRLHVDTHQHLMQGQSDNVLCVSARMATYSNWTILEFTSGETALFYMHVLCDIQRMNQATSRAFLFPFPPEAVAHSAFMFDEFYLANRRYIEQLQKDHQKDHLQQDLENKEADLDVPKHLNIFAQAMLCMGESVRFQEFEHKVCCLTNCAISDKRELPCVTFQHGFMFTIVFSDGQMSIRPCSRTQKWDVLLSQNEIQQFLPLPLQDDQENGVNLPSSHFRHVFRHGLCLSMAKDNSPLVTVDISYKDDCKRLPFYMFPVMHFPVLLLLEHNGWLIDSESEHGGKGMLLNNVEYFQKKHYSSLYIRDCEDEWFQANDSLSQAYKVYAQCKILVPDLSMHACFACSESSQVLGFWAQKSSEGQLAYFQSVQHLQQELAGLSFMDTSTFVQSKESAMSGASYLMLQHSEYGLATVRYAPLDPHENLSILVNFHAVKLELKLACDTFKPRLLSAGEETSNELDYIWGLTIENKRQAFVENGCYTVSSMASNAFRDKPDPVLLKMDFITMSRCMLVEGSEIWINITAPIYALMQKQALEQGYRIMLPVTKHLHNSMQGLRYLRGFYVLSGSLHDLAIENNHVRIICVIKHNTAAKRIIEDDNAGPESPVNAHTNIKNTRLVAFTLPVLENGPSQIFSVITHHRNEGAPFYKYLSDAFRA